MILLAISARHFTQLAKIRCIFVEISEQFLQVYPRRRRKTTGEKLF
jgi:hypothetical protein